ncbi:MAG TPA: hypothetical protein DCG47_04830 [Spirochaetaceae bacterium]|jgi:hypothetical protein|nr:hypothetical protein [Spirochaetaceae bacterium]
MGFKLFDSWKAKRDRKLSVQMEPQPEKNAPSSALDIDKPLDALSVTYLFPLAFQVGDLPVRARVVRLRSGTEAYAGMPESSWFFWKADTAAGVLSSYWELPGPSAGAEAASLWAKTAKTLAAAAAGRIKATLSDRPQTTPTSFSAGPCAAPDLVGKPVFRADFRYAARGAFREGSAYASIRYPHILARALAFADDSNGEDALGAMLAISGALRDEAPDSYWADRAFSYPGNRARHYLPLYELLNLLSDTDAQLVIQNYLVIKAPGAALGALFLYRGPTKTPTGVCERVVAPHSFDPQRVNPFLPASVFEDGRLAAANAADSPEDFLRRNDEAYEGLFQALRRDALSLSPEGGALIRSLYLQQVYSEKRRSFDALVQEGKPFDEFRRLPESLARRAADTSGAEAIAAGVYGSKEALAFVARWCSRRKQDAIAEELERIASSLRDGNADIGVLVRKRWSLMEKAAALLEADKREAGAGGKT